MPLRPTPGQCLNVLALLAGVAFAAPAASRTVEVDVARVVLPVAALGDVRLRVDWPDGADAGQLDLRVATFDAAELGYRFRDARWRCPLTRDGAGWECAGTVGARDLGSRALSASIDDAQLRARFGGGGSHVTVVAPLKGDRINVTTLRLPLTWLQPLLADAWPEATIGAGTLDGELTLDLATAAHTRVAGDVSLAGFDIDTRDGSIAAAGFGARGDVSLAIGEDDLRVETGLDVTGGEILLGPLYAALPAQGVRLDAAVASSGGAWSIERLAFVDAGVLTLQASGRIAPADADAALALDRLEAAAEAHDLATLRTRYLDSVLATAGLGGLSLDGRLRAALTVTDGAPQDLRVDTYGVDARDADGRFHVDGLRGDVAWTARAASMGSRMGWQSAGVHGIAIGATSLSLTSESRRIGLEAPASLPLLGGYVDIERLAWTPAGDAQPAELALGLTADGLSLSTLSAALDWPAFEGTLSGRMPSARYEDGVLAFGGDLTMQVFDGRVRIADLRLERPFGVAPTLSADIAIEDLALEPMTQVFGFGEITGRLDGRIAGLRLVDWEPVAFDAQLRTDDSADVKQRISQRAVNDLSSVGGAGVVAGIQAQVMKLFETFPYDAIGLSCRLENNVCHMGGLEPAQAGYTIVRGSGLPRITVIGHQRRVDWPVLVSRLEAATSGQTPVVD